jgi:hypothetical protein
MRDLRDACRRLTPVVVDLGPGQPRLESFLRSVDGRGRDARLVLSPIAADAIPFHVVGAGVTIRSADARCPLRIGAVALRGEERQATVALGSARLEWMAPRLERTVRGQEPLVLLVPGTDNDASPHIFPIVELGRDFCCIQATVPLEPGMHYDPVEVLGDRRRLRRGATAGSAAVCASTAPARATRARTTISSWTRRT